MSITSKTCRAALIAMLGAAVLTACSTRDSETPQNDPTDDGSPGSENPPAVGNPDPDAVFNAFVATRAPDFGSGQIERLSLKDGNIITGTYPGTQSDISVDTEGTHVYQIGRFQLDNITRFGTMDTSIADYQVSVNGDDTGTANPYDLAFLNESKAYLTRRSGTKIWVVDPSPDNTPATVDDFLISQLDLGAYAKTADGELDPPDMTDAIIVDNKLFVLMENLTAMGFNQVPDTRAYLAVFDITDDQEIDTMKSGNNLLGIQLLTINPTSLQYNAETGFIYVVGRGNFFETPNAPGDFYTGGVEAIDPTTYDTTLILDDGTNENNVGYFMDAIVINDTLGYLITLDGYAENFNSISNLRSFNPSTGVISDPLEGTAGQDLTSMAAGPDGHLWVGINDTQSGFIRVEIATGNVVADRVNTQLVPSSIVFIAETP